MKISKDILHRKGNFYNFNSSTWRKSYDYEFNKIEKSKIKLRKSQDKLNKIKNESIKEMIYSQKQVPISWRAKLNYQEIVGSMLAKDENFLIYVSNIGGNVKKNDKIDHIKIMRNKKNIFYANKNNFNRESKLFKNKSMDDRELNIYLTNLKKSFPIKKKLNKLFDNKSLLSIEGNNKINIKNNNIKSELKFKCITAGKRKENINKNIFINLVSNKSRNNLKQKFFRVQSAVEKNSCIKKKDNNSYYRKFKINNKYAMNQLRSINYYGPYYSYCPNCAKRNIDFYNNISSDILVDIVKQIKKNKYEKILKFNNEK